MAADGFGLGGNDGGEAIEVLVVRAEEKAAQPRSFGRIIEAHAPDDLGAVVPFVEHDREGEVVTGLEVPHRHARGRCDLEEAMIHRVAAAVGATHGETPRAARAEIEFLELVREFFWPPPPREHRRIGEGGKNAFS